MKNRGFENEALFERQADGGLDCRHDLVRCLEPAEHLGIPLAELVENRGVVHRRDFFASVANPSQCSPGVRCFPGECHRSIPQRSFLDQFVEHPHPERLAGADRATADDEVECILDSCQAGETLGAARAWQDTEFHFGKTQPGRCNCDAEMADERELQAAAQRRSMNRGDHRFSARLDPVEQLVEVWELRRLVQFGNVGTREERATVAKDYDRTHARIIGQQLENAQDAGADGVREGIDRGRVGDHQVRLRPQSLRSQVLSFPFTVRLVVRDRRQAFHYKCSDRGCRLERQVTEPPIATSAGRSAHADTTIRAGVARRAAQTDTGETVNCPSRGRATTIAEIRPAVERLRRDRPRLQFLLG